ncbi:hypothetical protein Cni_G25545 [Canna indica]|uniref:Uncharacterized protein n=1 Tax=Canna indica TaxID=4628 RepID=A0AAQ3L4I2_9LILI|nr:hypothetical protein Cni_G25545 [Canna indica]
MDENERECVRRKAMHATQCMPRLWRKSAAARTPAPLLERFREVVFKLIMISAVTKGGRTRRERQPGGSARQHGGHLHPESYRSEAVEDCIEFFKRSAEGTKSPSVCEQAQALEVGFASLQVM